MLLICDMCIVLYVLCCVLFVCVRATIHFNIAHWKILSHALVFSSYLKRTWHVLTNAFQMKCGGMMNRAYTFCLWEASLLFSFFATPPFCFPIWYFLVSGEFFSTAVIQMFAVSFIHSFIHLTVFYVGNLLAARHIRMVKYIWLFSSLWQLAKLESNKESFQFTSNGATVLCQRVSNFIYSQI